MTGDLRQLQRDFGLSESQAAALARLVELLTGAAARSVTRISEPEQIIDLHIRDSLSLLALPELQRASQVIDIGSGAGVPGLPLAIALPSAAFSLLEANGRKCDFIRGAVASLGLANVTVVCARAEDAGRSELREVFDTALARAVGPLEVVLEYALPFLRHGGNALLQRGQRRPGDEVQAAAIAAMLGGRLERIKAVQPYPEAKNLHIWVFHKIAATPERYPRRPGMPKKRPLAP